MKVAAKLIAVASAFAILLACEGSVASPLAKGYRKLIAKSAGEVVAVQGGRALARVTAEQVGKSAAGRFAAEVSGKKILAVGGAAAAVVAAHEIGDGVQQFGTGIGEAVQENPNVAIGIFAKLMQPVNMAMSLAALIGCLVIVWFVSPWLSLVRNWLKLRAEKRKIAMLAHPGYVTRRGIVLLALFLVVTVLSITALIRHDPIKAEYSAAIRREVDVFNREIEEVAHMEFGKVDARLPEIVDEFCSVTGCGRFMYYMVKDKFTKGHSNEVYVRERLERRFYSDLYKANDAVVDCAVRLFKRIEAVNADFRSRYGKEFASILLESDREFLDQLKRCGAKIENSKGELVEGQITAAVAVAVEAVLIRETTATVAKLLGKTAARQAATMTASAVAAAADGPSPILDIGAAAATIGCTVWTCVDVYRAAKVLPDRLRGTFESSVADCRRRSVERVKSAVEAFALKVS